MKFSTPFQSSSRKSALLIAAFVTSMAAAPMAVQAQPRDHGCRDCGTVISSRTVEQAQKASGLGAVGGAVVGGLLGNQVGSGGGRTAATVAGALGGALAGREIQRNSNSGQRYDVVVRYANGSTQTVPYENDPGFRVGDQVKVNDGVLTRD